MTIKEFFRIKANLAIHCDTEEKARKLLEAFDKAGHRWKSGGRYKYTLWEIYEEKTCYNNDGSYGRVEYFRKYDYFILEFDEIEFEDASFKACATDVQKVKHAHWVKSETDRQYCSICHEVRPYYFKETLDNRYAEQKKISLINWGCPYCPNCGAKMDENSKK